ncbi:MAG: hypothetical protein IPL35_06625 [Sphingobacteriales bacterium]|nr:hypothetical protein [Sphingobacteriales bacterium]
MTQNHYVIESQEIVTEAAEAFKAKTGGNYRIKFRRDGRKSNLRDLMDLHINGQWHGFEVQVEKFVTKGTIGYISNKIAEQGVEEGRTVLLISKYISPAMAEILTAAGINFLDAACNASIRNDNVYILVSGMRRTTPVERPQPSRAFQEAGIKALFSFINEPSLLNMPYRDISKAVGIALGSVAYVMSDLKTAGFLLDVQKKEKKLTRPTELLERWVTQYRESLFPKLLKGRFRFAVDNDYERWESIDFHKTGTFWSGEAAVQLLLGKQSQAPQRFTLYSKLRWQEVARHYGLLPDKNGDIELLTVFWNDEALQALYYPQRGRAVPPLLVYADLMGSADIEQLRLADILRNTEYFPISA